MSEAQRWDQEYQDGRWNFLHKLREAPRYGAVAAYLMQAPRPFRLLDIGCGDGVLMQYVHPSLLSGYVGVDLAQAALDRFEGLPPGGVTRCADLATYEPEGKFDAILFNEVLFFTADPVAEMARYRKALTPNGVMIVSLYAKETGGARRILDQVHGALTGPEWTLLDHCRLTTLGKGTNWQLYLAR
jgi:2-polyprenyl-6-hydroxyphenyl methylase/3-demethylubiquinone-9 3-methyltransferase